MAMARSSLDTPPIPSLAISSKIGGRDGIDALPDDQRLGLQAVEEPRGTCRVGPQQVGQSAGARDAPEDVDQRSGLLRREVMDLETLVQPGSDDTREPEDLAHRFHPRGWHVVSLLGQSLSRL